MSERESKGSKQDQAKISQRGKPKGLNSMATICFCENSDSSLRLIKLTVAHVLDL
jgi:hypothetical protein